MKDLHEAIFNVFNHSFPVKFYDTKSEIAGYLVNNEQMKILLAEYNIHFIEPEDKQEQLPDNIEMIIRDCDVISLY